MLYPSNSAPLTLTIGTLPRATPAEKLRVTLVRGDKGSATIPESGKFEFLATQTAHSTDTNLQVDVEASATPSVAGSWTLFTSLRRAPGAKTWTDVTPPRVPGVVYFRTVTYSDDLAPGYMPAPVGPITVTASPDLSLTITPQPESLPNATHPGEFIKYRLRYENNGSVEATNVKIAARLPKNTSYAAEQGSGHSSGLVTLLDGPTIGGVLFDVGTLVPGGRGEHYFTVQVAPTILDKVSTATIEYFTSDAALSTAPTAMGRSAKAYAAIFTDKAGAPGRTIGYPADGVSTTVYRPLQIELTQDRNTALRGGLITYTYTLRNHSAVALNNVKLSQILPAFTELETFASFSGGSFNGQARRPDEYQDTPADATRPSYRRAGLFRLLEWIFPSIPAHSSSTAIFTVRLQADTPLFGSPVAGGTPLPNRVVNNSALFAATYLSGTTTLKGDLHGTAPPEITLLPQNPTDAPDIQFEREAVGLGDGRGTASYGGRTAATVLPGDYVEYRLTCRNIGSAVARHCVVAEEIADGATFYGFLAINGQSPDPLNYTFFKGQNVKMTQAEVSDSQKMKFARKVVLSIGDLAPNAVITVSYRVRAASLPPLEVVSKPGSVLVSNSFTLNSDSLAKPQPGLPEIVPVVVVQPAVCVIEPTQPSRLRPYKTGDIVTITAPYRNEGATISPPMLVTAEMPEGVDFASARVFDAAGAEITVPDRSSGRSVFFPVGRLKGYSAAAPGDPSNGGRIEISVRIKSKSALPPKLQAKPFFQVDVAMKIAKDPASPPSAQRQPFATAGEVDGTPVTGSAGRAVLSVENNTSTSKPGLLFATKSMPKALTPGDPLRIKVSYGNVGDAAIGNVRVAIQIPYGTLLDTTLSSPGVEMGDRTAGYALKSDIAQWHVGDLPAHGFGIRELVVRIKPGTAYRNNFFTETSAVVTPLGTAANPPTVAEAIPGPVATLISPENPSAATAKQLSEQLQRMGGNLRGKMTGPLRSALKSLSNRVTTSASGADVFVLPNGAFIIPLQGGNVVAGGGGNVVAGGGGNVVAGGGGNVVAAGAGNLINVSGVGFCTTENLNLLAARVVAGDGGNVIAAGAGNIIDPQSLIANDGGTLIGNDGATLIANDGGTLRLPMTSAGVIPAGAGIAVATGGGLLPTGISGLIGQDAGGLVNLAGSALVSGQGSTLIANDGGTFISRPSAGLIGQDGAGLIGNDGAGLIGNDGSGLLSK